ncbi:MAG TPA: hypothetical protein VL944_01995 [Candidatus Acidoferrum sp.]|nr:hypothetical protein [Candidatus Acidoferrum sp.]
MADLWSDYTDALIKDIDQRIGNKYKLSVRDLLSNLDRYSSQPNISATISNLKEESNKYIDGLLDGMKPQAKEMDDSMAKASEITRQLAQNISMQAKQNNKPVIKPVELTRNRDMEEIIQVDNVNDQLLKLAERLVEQSNFVADFTFAYKNYNVGSWLFSTNSKDYTINVFLPSNSALDLEVGRQELNDLFDSAMSFVRG